MLKSFHLSKTENVIMWILYIYGDIHGTIHGELYGKQIVDLSYGKLKKGTLYTTLSRLEEKGWVTSRIETSPSNKHSIPRKYYTMTKQGFDDYRELIPIQRLLFVLRLLEEKIVNKQALTFDDVLFTGKVAQFSDQMDEEIRKYLTSKEPKKHSKTLKAKSSKPPEGVLIFHSKET